MAPSNAPVCKEHPKPRGAWASQTSSLVEMLRADVEERKELPLVLSDAPAQVSDSSTCSVASSEAQLSAVEDHGTTKLEEEGWCPAMPEFSKEVMLSFGVVARTVGIKLQPESAWGTLTAQNTVDSLTTQAAEENECSTEEENQMRRDRKVKRAGEKMDRLLQECFVACVVKSCNMRQTGIAFERDNAEGYLHMPMKGTKLYTLFMRPCRPADTSLDVKTSSFKSLRKFLEKLEEDGLLSLTRGLQDPEVSTIHYDHPTFGLPPVEAWNKGRRLTGKSSLSAPISLSGPISFGSKASRGLPSLSLGSLFSCARSAKDAEDSETQSTAALTSRSSNSTVGDESCSNFGSASVEAKEATTEELDQSMAKNEMECEEVKDIAENAIWLNSCGWTAGDFTTDQAWNYNMTWGPDEVSLAVEKGESLHVSKIEGAWAKAGSASSGRNGWMPSAILQRVVHISTAPFSGGPGYMEIEEGDRLAVFHREADWVYGACLRSRIPEQAPVEESSLVRGEQVLAEGWFPSSCTEWPIRACA